MALPSTVFAQGGRYIYLLGEYTAGIIDTVTHNFYDINANAFLASNITQGTIVGGTAGPHHLCVFDTAGKVFCKGQNGNGNLGNGNTTDQTNFVAAPTDSLGNTFRDVVQMCASSTGVGWTTAALKKDGTVWIWGQTDGGNRGNGTAGGMTTRPVQITFPGGALMKKIQMGFMSMTLSTTGDVYTWGANYNFYQPYLMAQCTTTPVCTTPTKVTIPFPAIDIACNGQAALVLTNQSIGSGELYGWGFQSGYIGVGSPTQPAPNVPDAGGAGFCAWPLDTAWSAYIPSGHKIKKIFSGSITNYAILDDGRLFGQGDNSNGGFGDGNMMFWRHYRGSAGYAPYAWDQQYADSFRVWYRKPRQIAVGKTDFVDVATGPALVFGAVFVDASGGLFGCGRNKGAVIANGLGPVDSSGGQLQSQYPNSWNIPWLTQLFPFATSYIARQGSFLCLDSSAATFCNLYPVDQSKAAPTENNGGNKTVTGTTFTLTGSHSVASGVSGTSYVVWTQVSGPAANIPVPGNDVVTVVNATPGTYVFNHFVQDTNFKTANSNVTITVLPSNTISFPAGVRIIATD